MASAKKFERGIAAGSYNCCENPSRGRALPQCRRSAHESSRRPRSIRNGARAWRSRGSSRLTEISADRRPPTRALRLSQDMGTQEEGEERNTVFRGRRRPMGQARQKPGAKVSTEGARRCFGKAGRSRGPRGTTSIVSEEQGKEPGRSRGADLDAGVGL